MKFLLKDMAIYSTTFEDMAINSEDMAINSEDMAINSEDMATDSTAPYETGSTAIEKDIATNSTAIEDIATGSTVIEVIATDSTVIEETDSTVIEETDAFEQLSTPTDPTVPKKMTHDIKALPEVSLPSLITMENLPEDVVTDSKTPKCMVTDSTAPEDMVTNSTAPEDIATDSTAPTLRRSPRNHPYSEPYKKMTVRRNERMTHDVEAEVSAPRNETLPESIPEVSALRNETLPERIPEAASRNELPEVSVPRKETLILSRTDKMYKCDEAYNAKLGCFLMFHTSYWKFMSIMSFPSGPFTSEEICEILTEAVGVDEVMALAPIYGSRVNYLVLLRSFTSKAKLLERNIGKIKDVPDDFIDLLISSNIKVTSNNYDSVKNLIE